MSIRCYVSSLLPRRPPVIKYGRDTDARKYFPGYWRKILNVTMKLVKRWTRYARLSLIRFRLLLSERLFASIKPFHLTRPYGATRLPTSDNIEIGDLLTIWSALLLSLSLSSSLLVSKLFFLFFQAFNLVDAALEEYRATTHLRISEYFIRNIVRNIRNISPYRTESSNIWLCIYKKNVWSKNLILSIL